MLDLIRSAVSPADALLLTTSPADAHGAAVPAKKHLTPISLSISLALQASYTSQIGAAVDGERSMTGFRHGAESSPGSPEGFGGRLTLTFLFPT